MQEAIGVLQTILCNKANIFYARGELDQAIALHREAEQICRKLNNIEGLAISLTNQSSILRKMGRASEALPVTEEAYQLAATHGYTILEKQIEPILNAARHQLTQNHSPARTQEPSSKPPSMSRESMISELRDSAATALKRGLLEAAETYLEKLLQHGEPVETVAPDLIIALLNAHDTPTSAAISRIELLLAQLSSAGHATLAAELRQKLDAKQLKKSKWKFW